MEMLGNPKVPGNRVIRKTMFITASEAVLLFLYRHFHVGVQFNEYFFVTILLGLLLLFAQGVIGSVLNAALYDYVLQVSQRLKNPDQASSLLAEWAFACVVPLVILALSFLE
ncbi:hypothetical protein MLD55_12975 [Alcanivorax sp. MM125-6]|nr:hypothetical protein [Alcanivorax sp. MM125-6]